MTLAGLSFGVFLQVFVAYYNVPVDSRQHIDHLMNRFFPCNSFIFALLSQSGQLQLNFF